MNELGSVRTPHPCIARRCGHATSAHLRTPELEAAGETVLWCARCHRHEVRAPRRLWRVRRSAPQRPRALPLGAV